MPFEPALKDPEKALALLQAFLEKIPYDFVLWHLDDPDDVGSFRLTYTAHRVAASTGLDLSPYIGTTMNESFRGYLESEAPSLYREVIQTGISRELAELHHGDDVIPQRVYRIIAHPVSANVVGVLCEDITAQKRAEYERQLAMEELAVQARELERSNQDLEEFAYVASHDLKSPLRDIENLASWIFEDASEHLPERSRQHLERLRDRVRRMHQLLNDLLEYSRAGPVFDEVDVVDVVEVLHSARELVAAPAEFQIVLPMQVPVLRTPRAPLQQVFINLLGNAIKHHHRKDGRVEVSWRHAGELVEFLVADDGPGIPQRFHSRVFRLFTTLRPRDDVEGSGMGLAMVKKLVETYGGQITLESEEGQGCRFRFTWPKNWSKKMIRSKE
jgi:signal transduction histidine kinase